MDAPKRIWAFEDYDGAVPRSGDWIDEQSECPEGSPGYILETEVAKLIAEAVAAERDRCAKLNVYIFEFRHTEHADPEEPSQPLTTGATIIGEAHHAGGLIRGMRKAGWVETEVTERTTSTVSDVLEAAAIRRAAEETGI